jgi:hypothetical protein
MTKVKTIKIKKEVKIKKEDKAVEQKKQDFKFSISFNNQTFDFIDEDLNKNVLSVAPAFLKTKILIVLEKEGKRAEKQLLGFQARQLFRNEMFRRITLQRLILK